MSHDEPSEGDLTDHGAQGPLSNRVADFVEFIVDYLNGALPGDDHDEPPRVGLASQARHGGGIEFGLVGVQEARTSADRQTGRRDLGLELIAYLAPTDEERPQTQTDLARVMQALNAHPAVSWSKAPSGLVVVAFEENPLELLVRARQVDRSPAVFYRFSGV